MNAKLRVLVIAAMALVVVLPACASDGGDDGASAQVDSARGDGAAESGGSGTDGSESAGTEGSDDAGESNSADGLVMVDVATGAETTMEAALAGSDEKPVLAWFWAPFCPTCRGEAPELDAFMAENSDRVSMVGIGTRNDLGQAEDFLADTGVGNFPLLWEESGQSWVDNAVAAQPYMILIVDGEDVQRWPGGASVRQIEDALADLA